MTATIGEAARHYAARDHQQAALVCLEIIRGDNRHFDALHLLGVICTNLGQHADAISYLLRADAVRSDNAQLYASLGSAYGAIQRFDKAVEAYRRALALDCRDAGVLNNLGLALRGLGRSDEAIDAFRAALVLDPANDGALYNLGRAKAAVSNLEGAEADFRVLWGRRRPDSPAERVGDTTNELASVLLDLGRAEEGLDILRAVSRERSDIPSIQRHIAWVLLLLGRFHEGWPAYETRWEAPNHDKPHCDYRVLDLDHVAGRNVFVKGEQGRGDVIQFLRYIRPLATRGARIALGVHGDLIPLAAELPEVEQLLGPEQDLIGYDFMTSIMSLPLAFRTDIDTIPAEVPYLRAPAARIGRVSRHIGPASRPRIGLVWSGSAVSQARSALPAAMLEPLLNRGKIEFHCLQKEILAEDQAWLDRTGLVTTHMELLRDFGDTAALIEAMDLVISIDTAVAHLAGALAKPVWIMLPFNPDWRWLLGRDDSPWYPTARLFRQPAPGDWAGVIRSVTAAFPY